MKCVLLGITAVIGLFALAESLTCNTCSLGLLRVCLNPSTATCTTNTSLCSSSEATFSGISGFLGFNAQNCLESSHCNITSGTILGATYRIIRTCCKIDKCNSLQLNGASYVHFSLSAVLSAALLACVWGQSVY